MPFEKLTDQQLLAVLAAHDEILEMPGVTMIQVDYTDRNRTEPSIIVYVYAGNSGVVSQLPTAVAGVPLIVKVENRWTGHVVETIDPRRTGGVWPDSRDDGTRTQMER